MEHVHIMNVQRDITQMTFMDYYTRLVMLAQTVYEWTGLPASIDEKHLERYLIHQGRCMLYNDFFNGWMLAPCADNGFVNYYEEPTHVQPVAASSLPMEVRPYEVGRECVVIHNNDYDLPTVHSLRLRAARLTEMRRTIDINVNAQKTPILLRCTDKQKLSIKNAYKQYTGNEPMMMVDKGLEMDSFDVFQTGAPIVFDKLSLELNRYWNETMTFLGVNNANTDKRERLVDDEVQANNEQITLFAETGLKARERAAHEISALTGWNVSCRMRNRQEAAQEPSNEEEVETE